jgi:hypothetical protein
MRGYAPPSERPPLLSYLGAIALFNGLFAAALLSARRNEEDGGPGEVEERSRGRGARRAIGEMLVCPLTISDFLQVAYKAAEQKGLG